MNDNPNSSDFAGSLSRYMKKLSPEQERLYCLPVRGGKQKDIFYAKKPMGKDSILATFREGATILGMDSETFCPHSLRAFFVTNLVNDDRVSLRESMAAARHTSASAHLTYMGRSAESEANRITALLDARRDKVEDPSTQEMIDELRSKRASLREITGKCSTMFLDNMDELDCAERELEELSEFEPSKKKRVSERKLKTAMLLKKCDVLQHRFNHANERFDCLLEKERLYNQDLQNSFEDELQQLKSQNQRITNHCSRLERDNMYLRSLVKSNENSPPHQCTDRNHSFCSKLAFTQEISTPVPPPPRKPLSYTSSMINHSHNITRSTVRNPYKRKSHF